MPAGRSGYQHSESAPPDLLTQRYSSQCAAGDNTSPVSVRCTNKHQPDPALQPQPLSGKGTPGSVTAYRQWPALSIGKPSPATEPGVPAITYLPLFIASHRTTCPSTRSQ